jgi:hypothetical protein
MDLPLTIEDADELLAALRTRLLEMRMELAHTDDRAYRAMLRKSLERLEAIEHLVEGLLEKPAEHPAVP